MRIAICDDEVASQERAVSYVEDYISDFNVRQLDISVDFSITDSGLGTIEPYF